MRNCIIKCKTFEEHKAAATLLSKLSGVPIAGGILEGKYFTLYPFIIWDSRNAVITALLSEYLLGKDLDFYKNCCDAFEFEDIHKLLIDFNKPSFKKEVVLSPQYTAVVTENGIKVGCTNISFDTFQKLVTTVKECLSIIK